MIVVIMVMVVTVMLGSGISIFPDWAALSLQMQINPAVGWHRQRTKSITKLMLFQYNLSNIGTIHHKVNTILYLHFVLIMNWKVTPMTDADKSTDRGKLEQRKLAMGMDLEMLGDTEMESKVNFETVFQNWFFFLENQMQFNLILSFPSARARHRCGGGGGTKEIQVRVFWFTLTGRWLS